MLNLHCVAVLVKGATGGSIFKFKIGTKVNPKSGAVSDEMASVRCSEFVQTREEFDGYLRKKGAEKVTVGIPKCDYGNFTVQLKPVDSCIALADKVNAILEFWAAKDAGREEEYLELQAQMDAHDETPKPKKGKKGKTEETEVLNAEVVG